MPAIAATTEPAAFVLRSVDGRLVIAKFVVVLFPATLDVTVRAEMFPVVPKRLVEKKFVVVAEVPVAFMKVKF